MAGSMVDELREELNPHAKVIIQPGMTVEGDRNMLAILIRNLIGNALKYSAKNSSAEVSFELKGESSRTIYTISDNGAGFDMAFADKLFQPFSRLHQEKEFPGNGIGLATVQQITERHAGNIWAESYPGKGATFYFTFGEERRKPR
jgi:light-regulated signal transduction histidine kinase (bacteriophytochrome)